MIDCKLCNKEFSTINGLCNHISKTHKVSIDEYYLKYLSTDPMDGNCHKDGCNNKTKFITLTKGFYKYCSTKCVANSKDVKEKSKQTCIDKYGVECVTQSEEFKNKSKKTILSKYGVENVSQYDKIKEKKKNIFLEKYGSETYMQSKDFKQKSKNTILDKYNVEYISQSEYIKNKKKQTCLNNYGVEYISQSKKFKERVKQTNFKEYFNSLFTSNRLQNKVIPNFTLNDYNGVEHKYSWICTQCNTIFEDHLDNGRTPRCPICYPIIGTSKMELEIFSFIQQYFPDAENGNRSIISPMELDIYIPSRNFAIEFDGLFWHSELNGKDNNYHLNKTNECAKKDIKLIHVFEDEWMNKQEIVKSIILSKLNLITNKIFARKCKTNKVYKNEALKFLNNNHLQNYIDGDHIGLYYNDELVSLLTYGKPRFNKEYNLEILRFCNKLNTTVVGGLSRLISTIKNKSIITYVDRRYNSGHSYINSNFKLIGESKPSYYYVKNCVRFNRMSFQKHLLNEKLNNFNQELTEWQNMQLSGYDRIWDCGNYIYELI